MDPIQATQAPQPTRRTVVRASAWSVPVIAAGVTAPAYAASINSVANLRFDTANVYGGSYLGSRPSTLESKVQVQHVYAAGAPTVTSMVLTVSYPDTAVSGFPALAVSGTGWTYTSATRAGARWVYRFDWAGTLGPGSSTQTLTWQVPIRQAPFPAGATVALAYTITGGGGTALASSTTTLPS